MQRQTDTVSDTDAEKMLTKLSLAANHYLTTNPGLSRYYMEEVDMMRHTLGRHPPADDQRTCPFCHAILRPGHYRVRLTPRRKFTRLVGRLRRRRREGQALGRVQERVLDTYEHGKNRVVTRCETCGNEDTTPGAGRGAKVIRNVRKKMSSGKKTQKRSSSEFEVPTSTHAKKKKKGHKKQQESDLNDSGLASSLSSASRTDSLSLSTISSVGLNASVYSTESSSRLSSGSAPFTSTPKLQTRSGSLEKRSVSTDSLASFLSSIQTSPGSMTENKNKQKGTKNKNKKNKGMSVLQRMLHRHESSSKDTRLNSLLQK